MQNAVTSVLTLGRQPELGLAELESLYGAAAVSLPAAGIAGLTIPAGDIDFARLGGSTRLAHVLAVIPSNLWKDVEKQLIKTVSAIAAEVPAGSKFTFGLSTYNIPLAPAKLGATGLSVKKIVRNRTGLSVRLVQNTELELGAAQVIHNKLTGLHGAEALIIGASDGSTIIARTTNIQDIESYTLRDRGRPKRDAKVGMLPPKLAQIIINLAVGPLPGDILEYNHKTPVDQRPGASMPNLILDPFCGTGVLLQEAYLMGYDSYGYDIDPRMIDYSQVNIDWLNQKYGVAYGGKWDSMVTLEVGDATTARYVSKHNAPIDRVACETYLGRPFTSRPEPEILARTVSEVNLILKKFLRNIHGQLPEGARLCLAVPAWQTTPGRFRHLPLLDSLEELGYNRVSFEHVRDEQLLYYREDQYVARQLLVLTRN